ncbi:putative dienelactone hydrolase oxidoreductase protein [Bradyrhizobium sp. STM 3843]|uniref:alpha/beta hydrolase family protein n=1 Tax=Bradyrhizobium sp. STM 3843 TaxID=551947 RepID=UPI00024042E3|nr:alpha/beta hydrolase [Bradyrhizobium sp. STM 3843]CCE07947.1 putative dienelactone hydrolase oxidoreductase protein [Bradyrhizobium sp. STM 3843]
MRFLALYLILLVSANVARADDTVFKVGVTTRDFTPVEPYDWRGARTHVLRVMIWYPAAAEASEEPQWIGPPFVPYFSAGSAARDAAPAAGSKHPLVLLSHGAGGTAAGIAWLGTALAAHGFVAVAVNHPGNNALEDFTVEGFSLWWLRAVDLSVVLDAMLADKTFGSLIDPARIGAAGHSAGGYTVIAAAGGITDPAQLEAFCRSPIADALCRPPPEASGMREKRLARLSSDPDFRQRYERAGQSYRDPRIRAALAMAPGLVPMFTEESLNAISLPIAIISGDADEIAPSASNAEALARQIPHATLKLVPHAGHYVFFGTCTMLGRMMVRTACRDPDGVDRDAVHAETIGLALDFFAASLR